MRSLVFHVTAATMVAVSLLTARLGPLAEAVPRWLPLYLAGLAVLLVVPFLWPRPAGADPRRRLLVILLWAIAIRAPLLATTPSLSDDVHRYVWEGRVVLAGADPFDLPPDSSELSWLVEQAPEWSLVNHRELPAIYPAGAQWFFAAVVSLSDDERVMRVALTIVDLLLVAALGVLLIRTRRRLDALVLYAWHPLVAVEVAASGHYEPLAILPMVIGLAFFASGRPRSAGLAWGFALATKYLGVLPALFAFTWHARRGRIVAAVVASALVAVVAGALSAPFAMDGTAPVGSLGTYAGNWAHNGALHSLLSPRIGYHPSRQACLGLLALWTLVVLTRDHPPGRSTAAVFVGLLYLSPVVHPWYGLWLLALLPVWPTLSGALLTGLLPLSYLAWTSASSGGPWEAPSWVAKVEYGLPVAAWPLDVWWRRRGSA